LKTNERPGTRAVLRHSRISAYKVRQVLDLIRGQDVDRAAEILALSDREAARIVGKLLASAVANAVHNDQLDAEDLYVSACFADEGSTLKRWRPRARGRATRIRKRTSHVTIIVSRMPDERIARRRAQRAAATSQRSRRVAGSRRRQARAEAHESAAAARQEAAAEAEAQDASADDEVEDVIDVEAVEVDSSDATDEADATDADETADVDGAEAVDETDEADETEPENADGTSAAGEQEG
jgi:large subunit ribosomal protein L22